MKIYEKDENRNIMPNTVNKLFSFLRSKSKSQEIVEKLLQREIIGKYLTAPRYYIYQNFLKSRMSKFIV